MEKDIQGDVSGDYGKLLLLLIKDPASRTYENADGSPAQPEEPHVIEQVEEAPIEQTPPVVDFSGFNANDDCERLRKAMKGLGTDEKTIIQILGNRSNKQRQELKKVFTSMFGRDLIKDLHSELSGDFRETIEGMMMTPAELGESHTSSLYSRFSGTSPNARPSRRTYAHLRSSSHGM